jgi:DNA-binding transcriptional ArsR family regulator
MHPLPDDFVELIAQHFRVLGDPTRIKLLDQLRTGEATVLELTALVGTTEQNVSKHLGVLQRAGIVGRRRQGNFSYYSIADEAVFELCEHVCGTLTRRAASFQRIVAARSTTPARRARTSAATGASSSLPTSESMRSASIAAMRVSPSRS